ncbi:PucR family transcriptional regulator [[Mycobacterium] nativiensis]|uniref:Helix-turn-helix domain-containing protein n=1 Tax=[Mycobacterium] nativiensis TaxID=2855503 RepID=A0ABU5XYZ1_9MYCO|nr:helix-turn-helix domain-containing protein [Mycolicibacter sp. MYC340]MEB3033145.1 helix-turn-helix domain-containing protein [Mycolicibacter sp. MYC340]
MADDSTTLLVQLAGRMLAELDDLVATMNAAEIEVAPGLAADRAIAEEVAASNRANVEHVLQSVLADPQNMTLPRPPGEAYDVIRTVVRRGLGLDVIFQSYRRGQTVVWHRFMQLAPLIAPSGPQLVEMIDRFAAVLFAYVDAALLELVAEAQRLREEMAGGALARRAETVRLILDGAPIDERVATGRLGYELTRQHTALVLWLDGPAGDNGELESLAMALARSVHARQPLTVAAGVRTLWAWIGADDASRDALKDVMGSAPAGVRVAVGPTLAGPAGFRASHTAALVAAQIVGDNPGGERLVTFADIEPILPLARDESAATRFVAETLGDLAVADERGERLRRTLRLYLAEADNASLAAARLHTHRNTVLQRVDKATQRLGYSPGDRRLAVMTALEVAHFVGPKVLTT